MMLTCYGTKYRQTINPTFYVWGSAILVSQHFGDTWYLISWRYHQRYHWGPIAARERQGLHKFLDFPDLNLFVVCVICHAVEDNHNSHRVTIYRATPYQGFSNIATPSNRILRNRALSKVKEKYLLRFPPKLKTSRSESAHWHCHWHTRWTWRGWDSLL